MAFTNAAAHWWPEWQMRVLVLGSLLVHMSLVFADPVRRSPKLRRFRFLVRWAYTGGDALAIYALATLLNRQKHGSTGRSRGRSDLELLWAPVLLIQLGGEATLSAYSLEDNEQWMRHVLTLVSKVTVALYIFFNWWSGERQLLNAAVLLFVVGIIKFSYKPWALRRASFTSMLVSSALETKQRRDKHGCFGKFWFYCTGYWMDIFGPDNLIQITKAPTQNPSHTEIRVDGESAGVESEIMVEDRGVVVGVVTTLETFITRVKWSYEDADYSSDKVTGIAFTPVTSLYKKFVNIALPYSHRLEELNFFLRFSEAQSYKLLKECLYISYKILYTRRRVTLTFLGTLMQLSLPFLTLASVVLFVKSHKGGFDVNDVRVTYILFCFTALHEFLPVVPFGHIFSHNDGGRWHDMVSQGSLLRFCARQEATKFIQPYMLKERINMYCHVEQKSVAKIITQRVRSHTKDGWKTYIYGPISYRGFNDLRGQWTLEKYKHKIVHASSLNVLASSLTGPFDASVVKWHVATDLCYYKTPEGGLPPNCARVISNYMAYLLFIRPEMLLPGARSALFMVASDVIQDIIKTNYREGRGIHNEQEIADLVNGHSSSADGDDNSAIIFSAKKLAEALGNVDNDNDRWNLIEGVWVEMLCFSAARCSGYLHARSLGDGGEFLSYIWLLWSAMGMETSADKIIVSEPLGEAERKREEEKALKRQQRRESPARDGGSIASSSTTVDISPYSSTA